MAEGIGLTKSLFSVFKASDFGTCRAWFKADSLSLNDGDAVGTWADQSGNARDLTQATGANKPLYKKGVANGKPAVLFDGTNDTMATAAFGARSHPVTVFVVAKRVSGTGTQSLLDGIALGNEMLVRIQNATGAPEIYSGSALLSGNQDIGSGWFVIQATFDTTASKLYLKDVYQGTGSIGSNTLTGIQMGADYVPSSFWNGYIAEAIYFDGALSATNSFGVRAYLMAKYQISYFTPSSITGLRSWFCADHIRGFKDGDAITTWADSHGTFDVTQGTAANRPLLKKFIQNNHHVLRFDGSNDYLQSSSFTASSQPHTIFVVCKNSSTAAIRSVFDGIASGNRHTINYQTTGHLLLYAGTSLDSGVDDGTSFLLCTAVFDTTASKIYKNGTLRITGAAGSHTLTGYTIGAIHDGSLPLNGDVGEILIYDGLLSAADRQRIEGALMAKWAI